MPYQWGGETPGVGFDCSGLTQWAWGQAGVGLPRTAAAQYDAITHVPLSALQPGDLVFWGDGGGISHVAMYVGGGDVVHAPSTGSSWCASRPSGTTGWWAPAGPDGRPRTRSGRRTRLGLGQRRLGPSPHATDRTRRGAERSAPWRWNTDDWAARACR